MSLPVNIVDPKNNTSGRVSENGEVIVAPLSYSTPYYISVDQAATPFEIIPGIASKRFVVTDMLIATSKDFGSSVDAETITVYEATPDDLTINTRTFTNMDLLRGQVLPITGLNLVTTETVTLVAIATDTTVNVTIAGYYVPID